MSAAIMLGGTSCVVADPTPMTPEKAGQYFAELKAATDADNGQLWGVNLYGPTLLVDTDNHTVIANLPDADGRLVAQDGVYVGTIGEETNISNTSAVWSGTHWAMIKWNAINENDRYDRVRLLVHESWHRIQDEIGIPGTLTANVHLDNPEGRLWMLLEFRALRQALLAANQGAQRQAIAAALVLREERQALFPDNNENAFERHEGMAEYTGLKLCGLPDSLLRKIVAKKMELAEQSEGLANSFAYLTGPAYGLLLDTYYDTWPSEVRAGNDLPGLMMDVIELKLPAGADERETRAEDAAKKYGIDELRIAQKATAEIQKRTVDTFRHRLETHGRLVIPNDNLQFNFNPMEKLVPFDSTGVIYKTMRLTGAFGVLEVSDGILRANNWQFFMVTAPDDINANPLTGEGYTLSLNPGWQVHAEQTGWYSIQKK